jgi:hypothetical protein
MKRKNKALYGTCIFDDVDADASFELFGNLKV